MKIILCRHGKPYLNKALYSRLLNSKQLDKWLCDYNASNVNDTHQPNKECFEAMQRCEVIFSSDLQRSIDSCRLLDTKINQIAPVFREAGFPIPCQSFLSLPLSAWLVCLRVLWLLGYSMNSESYKQAKKRAVLASEKLQSFANKHGSVGLVGHGIMNRLIANNLQEVGWKKIGSIHERKYWGLSIFEKT